MNRVVAATVATLALSACGPQEPGDADALPPELAQQEHALSIGGYCVANYGHATCFASPSGGTGPYTYTWSSYVPHVTITPAGSVATVDPLSCGSQFAVRVDVSDALGAYSSRLFYASCY
jgi:hypothetical protein